MERVSVIMPCYNDGAYIMEAIQSVQEQTYPNIELIVIDDGSDDQTTINILKNLKSDGIKVLHTKHLRPAGARNAGIEASTGKYIMPVDSDDRIERDYIEKAVQAMKDDPRRGVVYCHADLFGERSGPWELPEYSLDSMLLDNVVFVTALFKKEDWVTVGGFRTNMEHGMEDYDFWLSILELGRDIYQLPEVLFHYRIKKASRTTQFQENAEIVKQVYRDIYRQHPILYDRYQNQYAIILRDALIEQLFLNRAYQKSIGILESLKKIPIIKIIIKQIILQRS